MFCTQIQSIATDETVCTKLFACIHILSVVLLLKGIESLKKETRLKKSLYVYSPCLCAFIKFAVVAGVKVSQMSVVHHQV